MNTDTGELAVIYWDGNPTKYQLLDSKLALSQGWNRITKSFVYENQHHQRSISIMGTLILKSGQQGFAALRMMSL
jgi:hypothetical protein